MNTTQLIASIKRKTSMPTSQNLWTDDRILDTINEEFQLAIIPLMMKIQEDHFLTYQAYTPFQQSIPIPEKAIGSKIRSVGFYQDGNLSLDVPRIDQENTGSGGKTFGFAFENYSLKFFFETIPSPSMETRLYYYKRPNSLSLEENVSQISAVDTVLNTVTVGTALPYFVANTIVSIQSKKNPHVFREAKTIVSLTGSVVTLDSVEGIEVGDYVCPEDGAFFPNIPQELHSLLAQKVAVKILEANGSATEMAAAQGISNLMEANAIYILTPRADGTTTKFTPARGIGHHV
jgi:hypothetical protein